MVKTNEMIEVKIDPNKFLVVKETLERIGNASFSEKRLVPSCYILFHNERYYIAHFKQLFALDNKEVTMSDDDLDRLAAVSTMLEQWGIVKILSKKNLETRNINTRGIKIVSFSDKKNWTIDHKFTLGKKSSKPR